MGTMTAAIRTPPSTVLIISLLIFLSAFTCNSFSVGGSNGNASPSPPPLFDRFRASCPAHLDAIRQFDPTLLENVAKDDHDDDDVWVAVYRSANNLPNVFVRDAFFDAMRASTTTTNTPTTTTTTSSSEFSISTVTSEIFSSDNDSSSLSSSSSSSSSSSGVMVSSSANPKPVAVARLSKCHSNKSKNDTNTIRRYMIDSMRCTLKKENTDPNCDGGSEHAEAVGICIDELVLLYLRRYYSELEKQKTKSDKGVSDGGADSTTTCPMTMMSFDGGIRFRGTLVSGKLLDSRGFREAAELSSDMHSHESDLDGAMHMYAQRSTSMQFGGSARDRATQIVSYLGRLDREDDIGRGRGGGGGRLGALTTPKEENDNNEDDVGEGGYDPWASVKKFI